MISSNKGGMLVAIGIIVALMNVCVQSTELATTVAGCDRDKLIECEQKFIQIIGFNGNDWSDPFVLRRDLVVLMSQGQAGLMKVCRAWNAMHSCLAEQEPYCFSPLNLLQMGFHPVQAYEFASIFKQFHFTCSAGYNTALNNWYCIANTMHTYGNTTILQCYEQFYQGVITTPSEDCPLANQLLQCTSQIFAQACNQESSWWHCSYVRYGLFPRHYHCGHFLDCYVHPSEGGPVNKGPYS